MAGSTILITGGTGFLGRHLALALRDDHEVVLGGRNNKQNAFAASVTGCRVIPLDVTGIESVRDAVVETRPDAIVHAAATKFVDLSERAPLECIDVNVVGSENVARVALDRSVPVLLGISTDKAAPPVHNIYGLSKAIMERTFCGLDSKSETAVACVRYGNVAWSTGSVFPVWKGMHDETGVIESTGPGMRRFFFTVEEAVDLVSVALANIDVVRGGVLSRPMGAALIRDLLETWIEARGGSWKAIEGRPGDSDDEYLIGEAELPFATTIELDRRSHFLITFNRRPARPLTEVVSSATAPRLTPEQMLELIDRGPGE
jgi:UDP-N-acetylglucosamine 4,6-dehydratase/5-epimerase